MKNFMWGLAITCAIMGLGYLFNFHPVAFFLLSLFIAGIIVYDPPFMVCSPDLIKEKDRALKIEVEIKKRMALENEALRACNKNLLVFKNESIMMAKNMDVYIQEKLEEKDEEIAALAKAYADLLMDLNALRPDKKRGFFSAQHLFKLKETYQEQITKIMAEREVL